MTLPRLRHIGASLALLTLTEQAATTTAPSRIDAFVTGATPMTALNRMRSAMPDATIEVHRLDGIERVEVVLNQDLPSSANSAEATALHRLQDLNDADRKRLEESAHALVLAWQYALRRYPAVVIDGRWVVYGVTDLERAVAIFRQRHRQSGS